MEVAEKISPECKKCKDEVNWKGYIVKHHYSNLQFAEIHVGHTRGDF